MAAEQGHVVVFVIAWVDDEGGRVDLHDGFLIYRDGRNAILPVSAIVCRLITRYVPAAR
jgi:hypothetical protein